MIIQGFSTFTSYDCMPCHAKCCATDYNLPLVGTELHNLKRDFPEITFYLQSSTFGDQLLRGDACSFLSQRGDCKIHDTKFKPISCEIYPLIIWRFSQNDTLIWINPCRGRSFTWRSDKRSKLNEEYFQTILKISKDYFKTYWGEEIDRNNPYINIPTSRIYEQVDYFNSIVNGSILQNIIKRTQTTRYKQIIGQLNTKWISDSDNNHIRDLVDSVIIWLSWSPVGLQLSQSNSQWIFSIAALLIIESIINESTFDLEIGRNPIYLNHVGSYLATSILPSFWENIKSKFENKHLILFSDQVIRVLKGLIPQQSLFEFTS
ncbi:MAG: YkgJ family cysteine cluster protein [Candidatus Hodarchaeales archaeon]